MLQHRPAIGKAIRTLAATPTQLAVAAFSFFQRRPAVGKVIRYSAATLTHTHTEQLIILAPTIDNQQLADNYLIFN